MSSLALLLLVLALGAAGYTAWVAYMAGYDNGWNERQDLHDLEDHR